MKQTRLKCGQNGQFKRRLLHAALMSAFSGAAVANPTGPSVVNGQVSFNAQGNTLAITNTPNAIINWQSFSISGNETTRFVQQSAASAVLNRVTGIDPSMILGTLQSNGRVFLVNPSGIIFGAGSRVDVAGLVASTLNLNNQDFLAGRLNFTDGALAGRISNQGVITTPSGGSVILVAPQIENSGIITAPNGDVILAAGRSVRLGDTAAPNVLVEIQAPDTQAINVGDIVVAGGRASIYAGLIQQKGVVSADTAALNSAGKIVFKATKDVTIAAGSKTTANGASGGQITVQADSGSNLVFGDVSATGSTGKGGDIRLLGAQVGVAGNARINASGAAGGGSILLGGDYKGSNPDIQNARATYFGSEAIITADATDHGNGGHITLWSDEVTRAYGLISARGGTHSGNGGFVETSSKGYLEVTRAPALTAPNGIGGTWLLDPSNIEVISTVGTLDLSGGPIFTAVADNSTISNTVINAALDSGASVTLDTSNPLGTQSGDITVSAAITKSAGAPSGLTFLAHNNININAGISATNGSALNLVLTPDQDSIGGGIAAINSVTLDMGAHGSLLVPFGKELKVFGSNTVSAGLSNAGTLTVEPGASLTLNGTSNNTSTGTIDVWANDGAGNQGYSTLTVGGAMTNAGTIELRGDASSGYYATLNLSSATLANSGLIHSTLAGTGTISPANGMNLFGTGSVLTNTGTVQVDQPLTSNINSDQQFDTSGGTLQVAGGQVLQFSGGGTVVVGATSFGTGAGTVAVNGGTLNVASDTTVGGSGATLSLSSATVNGPGTLTNQGTLTLLNDTINAALTNQGTVKVFSSNTASAGLSNAGTLTVEPGASLTLNGTSNNTSTGTIDVWANDGAGSQGYSTLTVGGVMANAGTIGLVGDSNNGYYATLNLSSGTLANSGLIHSTLAGTGTISPSNIISLYGTGSVLTNTGTVQVDQTLTSNINGDRQFDTSGGTLQVAGGQVLQFSGGGTVVVGATSFGTGAGTVAVEWRTLNVAATRR